MNRKQQKLYQEQQKKIDNNSSQMATFVNTIDGLKLCFKSSIAEALQEQREIWETSPPSQNKNTHSPPLLALPLSRRQKTVEEVPMTTETPESSPVVPQQEPKLTSSQEGVRLLPQQE